MSIRAVGVILLAVFTSGWLALAQPDPQTVQQPAVPRANDSLDGTWSLVSLIEDGKLIPLEMVRQTMIQNGRVVVSGQLLGFNKPDGTARTLAFVLDTTTSPKRIDLAGTTTIGHKGIYLRDNDTLLICFPTTDSESRPTEFASLPGSDKLMMTFSRVKVVATTTTELKRPARPAPPERKPDDDLKTALVGTWGHQNDEHVLKGTFNPDGTFSIVTSYKKGLKKLFDTEDRSSGTWRVKDGIVILTTAASTVKNQEGQVSSYRVQSINGSEVIYIDNKTGGRRIEWKLR